MKGISQANVSWAALSLVNYFRKDPWIWVTVLIIGLPRIVLAGRYDAFRNVLYFIVCGRHPDFGFVDQRLKAAFFQGGVKALGEGDVLARIRNKDFGFGLVLSLPPRGIGCHNHSPILDQRTPWCADSSPAGLNSPTPA